MCDRIFLLFICAWLIDELAMFMDINDVYRMMNVYVYERL